jgi:hypothetical protein
MTFIATVWVGHMTSHNVEGIMILFFSIGMKESVETVDNPR